MSSIDGRNRNGLVARQMIKEKVYFNQIGDFVSKQTFNSKDNLTLQTRLGEDLCVLGDDANRFLDKFSKQFNVNLSTIIFNDYFPDEASPEMFYYLCCIAQKKASNKIVEFIRKLEVKFWKTYSKKTSFKTITLKKLLFVAIEGEWRP